MGQRLGAGRVLPLHPSAQLGLFFGEARGLLLKLGLQLLKALGLIGDARLGGGVPGGATISGGERVVGGRVGLVGGATGVGAEATGAASAAGGAAAGDFGAEAGAGRAEERS
ncbi:MAG: hypothetical protein HZY79_04095 [Rhodoblastus sp.]|nr:MAG: hypothetical protein HZY79_04095 [Rhodoblastus sp.]